MNFSSSDPQVDNYLKRTYAAIHAASYPAQLEQRIEKMVDLVQQSSHVIEPSFERVLLIRDLNIDFDLFLPNLRSTVFSIVFENCKVRGYGAVKFSGQVDECTFVDCELNSIFPDNRVGDLFLKDTRVDSLLITAQYSGSIDIKGGSFGIFYCGNGGWSKISAFGTKFDTDFRLEDVATKELRLESCDFNGMFLLNKFDPTILIVDNCNFSGFDRWAEEGYRVTKKTVQSKANERLVELFTQLEIKAHNIANGNSGEVGFGTLSMIYSGINDYGLSVLRPFFLVVYGSVCFFCLAYGFEIFQYVEGRESFGQAEIAAYYTFKILLGPFGLVGDLFSFKFKDLFWGSLIKVAMIASSLLWFFLIIGIRRRFRMKE